MTLPPGHESDGPPQHPPAYPSGGQPPWSGPAPYQPAPYQPAPYQPAPYQPAPYQPTPHQPTPHQPTPHQPTPHQPTPHQPTPHQPAPYRPAPIGGPAPRPPVLTARRWAARLMDWLLPWLVSSPVWFVVSERLKARAARESLELAGSSFLALLADGWRGARDAGAAALADFWDVAVVYVTATLLAQVLLVALYDIVSHRYSGRTPGKILLGLDLVPVRSQPDGTTALADARPGVSHLAARAGATVLLPGTGCVLVVVAVLRLDVLPMLAGVVMIAMSVGECLALRRTGPVETCWHDRVSRTAVTPTGWNARFHQADELNRRAIARGREAATQAWQAPAAQRAVQQTTQAAHRVRDSRWGQALGNCAPSTPRPTGGPNPPAVPPPAGEPPAAGHDGR